MHCMLLLPLFVAPLNKKFVVDVDVDVEVSFVCEHSMYILVNVVIVPVPEST